ncbi:GNAT family N-acetyltransferase [Mesorhizobium sp. VK22B]|uniref:GNAT family N-acetyltransferase n=1 Tax=Mesorhizobium captivum TaxID=3072319 RepID=A0ABU4Z653_9HYPH|nr:GNAT family N-acetyltransferase [Mesorhizobium sp. VK22B]MDX8494743.1 GNAT family N-acetyltransferase [Mesorhizobium sp. VK22B]
MQGYQRFYDVDIPESVTLKTPVGFLDPIEPMHAAVAMMGELASGLEDSIYHRSAWTTSDDCYLQDLFVVDYARGGGVGRPLIEHVYADARRRGAPRVCWLTRANQTITPGSFTTASLIARVSSTTENYLPDALISQCRCRKLTG